MKLIFRHAFFSIIFIISIIFAFEASAESSSSSNDQWIAFCLTTQEKGKATDDCLDMGGIWKAAKNRTKQFKLLSPEVSERLDLTLAPTSKPTPLIFGHYWRCINREDSGFESCEPVLVVCTDDQSWCVETP